MFAFIGNWLLSILGITLPASKIAGGVLLFLIAIDMVFARPSGGRSATGSEQEEARHTEDISVFPLAFPLIAGPGALTTVLLMVGETHAAVILHGADRRSHRRTVPCARLSALGGTTDAAPG